jgi:hypothetical protein
MVKGFKPFGGLANLGTPFFNITVALICAKIDCCSLGANFLRAEIIFVIFFIYCV